MILYDRRSSALRAFALIIAASAASAFPARSSFADLTTQNEESARLRYNEGLDLRDAGDTRGALAKLQEAHALLPTPLIDLALARAHISLGQLVEARDVLRHIRDIPVSQDVTAKSAAARAQATQLEDELARRIPVVHVSVRDAPGGRVYIAIDDAVVANSAAPITDVTMNPGSHTVAVTPEGMQTQRKLQTVEVKDSETRTLVFSWTPERSPEHAESDAGEGVPRVPASPAGAASKTNTLTYIGFGVAGAGIVVGSITGVIAFSKASKVKDACPSRDWCTTPGARDDFDSSRSMGTLSTIGFVVAGAGATLGIVGLLTSSSREPAARSSTSLWLGLGSAGVRGAF